MAEVYAGPVTSARSQRKSISGNNFQPVAEHERELEIPPLAEELDTERQVDRQSVSFLYYSSDCPCSV